MEIRSGVIEQVPAVQLARNHAWGIGYHRSLSGASA